MLKLYKYHLPVTRLPFEHREGLLLCHTKEDREESWHEIAPLPNWSLENLETLVKDYQNLSNPEELSLEKLKTLSPSLAFGLQSLLCFGTYVPFSIPFCGHLMGSSQEIIKDAELLHEQGCTVVKIKTGNLDLLDAKSILQELSKVFRLRIDANKTWDLLQAKQVLSSIPAQQVDYVEEPLANAEDLVKFPFPFALDESLRKIPSLVLSLFPQLKALVVKPTMEGIFSEQSSLYQSAKNLGLDLVLSSSFETSIGIYQIARLCKHLGLQAPSGIGTYRYFSSDLLQDPLQVENGNLIFPKRMKPKWNYLTPLL